MTRVFRSISAIGAVARDESGAAASWSAMWFIGCLALGGVAVDAANAFNMKSRLQSVADASALAAVMQIDDRAAARTAAVSLAERNMPPSEHGAVINVSDIRFGMLDADTGAFIEAADSEPAEMVRIVAGRSSDRGNAVPTYLLRLIGPSVWEVGAAATAQTSGRAAPPPVNHLTACPSVMIMTSGELSRELKTGGNSNFGPGVCLYADLGVNVTGNNCFEVGSHIISPDADLNRISPLACGVEEDVVVEAIIEPKLLPEITGGLFDLIFTTVNNAGKIWGDNETQEQLALLPPHLIGARIQRVNMGSWNVENAHLRENYIYLVDHGVQFTGGTEISNSAFIVNGKMGISGGNGIKFDNIFFFSRDSLNFTGNATLGDSEKLCGDGFYRVYLFSEDNLSIGGGNAATSVSGLMGAAPGFDPGGGLKDARGMYIETSGKLTLGGGSNLSGCNMPLTSIYDDLFQTAPTDGQTAGAVLGASLVQ
jgi:hypothetical protein